MSREAVDTLVARAREGFAQGLCVPARYEYCDATAAGPARCCLIGAAAVADGTRARRGALMSYAGYAEALGVGGHERDAIYDAWDRGVLNTRTAPPTEDELYAFERAKALYEEVTRVA